MFRGGVVVVIAEIARLSAILALAIALGLAYRRL